MIWLSLLACSSGPPTYTVEGVVVEVTAADEVILDHEAVPGLMEPMTMPFHVRDPELLKGLTPGDKVRTRFEIGQTGGFLTEVDVTGHGPAPEQLERPGGPLRVGGTLVSHALTLEDGSRSTVGADQGVPTALTYVYTRCPLPEFCPATVAKFQALQGALKGRARLLAVTIDPAHDTPEVLAEYARTASADPAHWRFGVADDLPSLALAAALPVDAADGEILHGVRVLLLNADGELLKRYDDHSFSIDEAVRELTGG